MKHLRPTLGIAASAIAMASFLSGCTEYNGAFTYSELSQQLQTEQYETNFIAEYGDLSQVKSWDLSSLGDELNYLGGAMTRTSTSEFSDLTPDGTYSFHPLVGDALGNTSEIANTTTITTGMFDSQTDENYYYLPSATFDWLTKNLTENIDHRDKGNNFPTEVPGVGKNFKVLKPQGDFWLLPIYQGKAVSCYDLHLVVNGTDYLVWTKGQGLEYSKRNYEYLCYFKFTKDDGSEGEYYKKYSVNRRSNLTSMKKVGDSYSADYTILSDDATLQDDGTYKHIVTYYINGKNEKDGIAKNEIINGSETNLTGQKYKFNYIFCRIGDLTGGEPTWVKLSENTTDIKFNTLVSNGAWEVRSKPIHFDASKFQGDFFFYLEITKSQWDDDYTDGYTPASDAAIPGTKQRSDKGMMAAMAAVCDEDIAAVTGSSTNINALLLGCEAANRRTSDYDYNDVVFLMVSNSPQTLLETEERRYLCEDLGSTYDFDFNDIVVDVKQTQLVTTSFTETDATTHAGTWTRTLSDRTQTVSIAHMCGTIPFQVYVGDADKTKAGFCFKDPMTPAGIIEGTNKTNGYTPTSSEADVAMYCLSAKVDEGDNKNKNWWNPTTNNIYIDVWPDGIDKASTPGTAKVWTAAFPQLDPTSDQYDSKNATKVPQMIAVDPVVKWMPEKTHIPAAWVNAASTINDIKNETTTSSSETTGN